MGLKQFFEKDELEEIYKFVIYQGIRLVLIENAIDKESYDFEKKLIVDLLFLRHYNMLYILNNAQG